jgi:hypothetical protein
LCQEYPLRLTRRRRQTGIRGGMRATQFGLLVFPTAQSAKLLTGSLHVNWLGNYTHKSSAEEAGPKRVKDWSLQEENGLLYCQDDEGRRRQTCEDNVLELERKVERPAVWADSGSKASVRTRWTRHDCGYISSESWKSGTYLEERYSYNPKV